MSYIEKIQQLTKDCDAEIREGLVNWVLDVSFYASHTPSRQGRLVGRLADHCNLHNDESLLDTLAGVAAVLGIEIEVPDAIRFDTYQEEMETTRECEETEAAL